MATIHVDGKTYEVDGADNLLQACLSLGLDIPYFCWHPALGSVGACRQCAVKQYQNADDKRGRLVMSCMTPSTDESYISIEDEEAKAFRESVVEWLMINHPHDCPVCEEGGHCHLQDMTVMTGHNMRRYRFTKRTHQNQYLGPFIAHEMNRCIACYRCVRYYNNYADGTDLGVYGAHDNVYFGRTEDGVLENEFSGNLVEVCPTGVFTDQTHSDRYNRKWDMQFAPSVCQQCGLGCNTSPGERYGELRRIENRYNGSVNHYFLCDRGRFGYGYVNRKDRPRQASLVDRNGELQPASIDGILDAAAGALSGAKRIIGIGSPRASVEANHVLRELVGADNFSSGMADAEQTLVQRILDVLRESPVRTPSLREMEDRDAIFVLGEDVTQTAPRIALALRQAVRGKARDMAAEKNIQDWQAEAIRNIGQHERNPLFIGSFQSTRLDDVATETVHATAEDLARLGFAVAHAIDPDAPVVSGLDDETQQQAARIAEALLASKRPLLVSGTGAGSDAVIQATANIALALHKRGKPVAQSYAVAETNSIGVALLQGMPLETALQCLDDGSADGVVILENDLYRRADSELVDRVLEKVKAVVVDHQATATSDKAAFLLPAASFAEGDGTVVSSEGRAQRFFQVYDPTYYEADCQIRESWRWLHALHCTLQGQAVNWTQLDEVTAHCADGIPALAGIRDAAPAASFRIKGLRIAREPNRYSGRTSMRANISVHEPRAPQDIDTALSFSMEGYSGTNEPSSLVPFAWSPGWNSPQAWNKFQDEVGGHLKAGDPGVRLIEPAQSSDGRYFSEIPDAFSVRDGQWRILPLHHIFGSEELSSRAAPLESRIPDPYLALAPADAERLGVTEGAEVTLTLDGKTSSLAIKLSETLPSGTVGIPVGLTNTLPTNGESWAQLTKEAR
ncbi:NADH-quinone oxidoreductase subunit NuoG [Mangrovitalea sediminis]|uniref:NADH-quinone oxidoreductase subunit NuoG n=1 Tax=Mangrovitalea sediminis TaxID=1982043 RepID=UPI000BE4DDDE|nr:NADH-quinone oxidoreductase subunit NuoG [Mangrovitalea sediminis]